MVTAIPLEEDRYNITQEDVANWHAVLEEAFKNFVNPTLILNLDETGFNSTDSKDTRSIKVLASKTSQRSVHYRVERGVNHISALCAITASGSMLLPGLVHKNQTLNPDAGKCTFVSRARVYSSNSAYVDLHIYEDYIGTVVLHYIRSVRENFPRDQRKAVIIVDGHKAHISDDLLSVLAQEDIAYLLMPPHSSHLFQPLDRLFFPV
jgi:hypothetical protein